MPKSVFLQEEGDTTLKGIWREFKEKKIVVHTRVVGKAKMYKLNLKNPVVSKFIDYYWAVVDAVVRRENDIGEKEEIVDNSSSVIVPMSARNV